MFQTRLFTICFAVTLFSQSSANEQFPYEVNVIGNTFVRSGPGIVHYASQQLTKGTTVEVWRHDPGGWCAVRPPDGSHSWVLREHVELTDDARVGKVNSDDARAWVGSTDESIAEYMWQVKLRRGEFVEILGTRQGVSADGGDEDWYKIAPPAGEFRWIQQKFLQRQTKSESEPQWNHRADASRPSARKPLDNLVQQASATAEEPVVNDAAESTSKQLVNLNIELSHIIAKEPRLWDLNQLRKGAVATIGGATTDLDRGQAKVLLDRIDEFQTLKTSLESGTEPPAIAEDPAVGTVDTVERSNQLPPPTLQLNGVDPRFDGFGWLVPVVLRDENRPAYALVDNHGSIKQYVTPAPGFNLHRYLRQEIGIYGQRGYMPGIQKQHVTANRVVVLDRHRR